MNTILECKNLYFSYSDNDNYALKNVNLSIKQGQKIALMGANGSGKSTFFLCCAGILKPCKGNLFFHNEKIKYDRKNLLNLRSKIGIVFQEPDNQLFCASVYEEISFGVLNLGFSEEETRLKVDNIIKTLNIQNFCEKPTHALSGGQKKQVAIADILVMSPEIIIFDEPAAALDPKHIKIVREIIDKLTENGLTVIMSTHDVDYAYEWADEIILFDNGEVIMQAKPIDIFTNNTVLDKTNLEKPTVIKLFESINDNKINYPKNLKELETYIKARLK